MTVNVFVHQTNLLYKGSVLLLFLDRPKSDENLEDLQ